MASLSCHIRWSLYLPLLAICVDHLSILSTERRIQQCTRQSRHFMGQINSPDKNIWVKICSSARSLICQTNPSAQLPWLVCLQNKTKAGLFVVLKKPFKIPFNLPPQESWFMMPVCEFMSHILLLKDGSEYDVKMHRFVALCVHGRWAISLW